MVRDYSKRAIFLELFAVLGILLEKNRDLKSVVESNPNYSGFGANEL